MASLQSIFCVKLPNASAAATTVSSIDDLMDLPDTAQIMALRKEDNTSGPNQSLEAYKELASDILTEVLMNMSRGTKTTTKQIWNLKNKYFSKWDKSE